MIKVDRCGWCKHDLGKKGTIPVCKAFPNGYPIDFEENGEECNRGYHFEVDSERQEVYQQIWEEPLKDDGIEFEPIEIGNITIE
ncbi:MAG: hypothetical protein PUI85_00330 [Eubacteriales bacterium]|nr:hypothetical protein [Eubacteriales bacterium]MDY3333044.1 hypothetical protein [Gallibacter sp.]